MDYEQPCVESHQSAGCRARIWVPARGIIVTRASGVGDLGAIRRYTAWADRQIDVGSRLRSFHHWSEITRFEAPARAYLRSWASERSGSLLDAHYLVSSKLIAMAIGAAALALGRSLTSYTREGAFEQVLDEAISRAR